MTEKEKQEKAGNTMQCINCGYVMSAFDKECPRCQGQIVRRAVGQTQPIKIWPTTMTPVPIPSNPWADWSALTGIIGFMLSLIPVIGIPLLVVSSITGLCALGKGRPSQGMAIVGLVFSVLNFSFYVMMWFAHAMPGQ